MLRKMTLGVSAFMILAGGAWAAVADFDDLTLPPNGYWNGSTDPAAGGFSSGGVWFENHYVATPPYPYWYGWSYSNTTDTATNSYTKSV